MEFPTTHWTQLAQATLHGDAAAGAALGQFIRRYRAPIVGTLRARGVVESRVEDMAHEFLLQLMEHSSLRRADPQRGRFRCFLAGALSRFLYDDVRENGAQKRGGGAVHVGLEEGLESSEDGAALSANDLLLDREWALHLMDSAMGDLEAEWAAAGKCARFSALRPFLPGASTPANPEEAMRLTDMSDTALRTEVSRLRKRLRELVRARVADSVVSPADVDAELAHLHHVLTAC